MTGAHPRSRGEHWRSRSARSPVRWAHPRSRGEHPPGPRGLTAEDGSSPLARGAPLVVAESGDVTGLIPARAGSTTGTLPTPAAAPAHPRSRGEHHPIAHEWRPRVGSSPLARGALDRRHLTVDVGRLIPARAGSTPSRPGRRARPTAHPRSRGEHGAYITDNGDGTGSSPLARGARARRPPVGRTVGLIPARAGSTVRDGCSLVAGRAHPRSRGEHNPWIARRLRTIGSSPLARGARAGGSSSLASRRLIPARAGSTPAIHACAATSTAHPRSRGEHTATEVGPHPAEGSSPLARGARAVPVLPRVAGRLIPARAGSTRRRSRATAARTAHPRSRGEHTC